MNLLIFGDQTGQQSDTLRGLCSRTESAILGTFLDLATAALREEVNRLPQHEQPLLQPFQTLSSLVDAYYDKGLKDVRLESSMLVIAQLGEYIV